MKSVFSSIVIPHMDTDGMGMCDLLLSFSRFNHLFKNLRKFGHFFSHHPPKVDRHVTAPAEKQSTPTQNKNHLAILCWWPFWVWLSDPFKGCWWPPTMGWKGHFQSPGAKILPILLQLDLKCGPLKLKQIAQAGFAAVLQICFPQSFPMFHISRPCPCNRPRDSHVLRPEKTATVTDGYHLLPTWKSWFL